MRALITGIAGQDGSYLAEFLLSKNYKVFGLALSSEPLSNIKHLLDKITLIFGDLTDQQSLDNAIKQSMPDEIYHLASISFVGVSWEKPLLVGDINALGTVRLLESARRIKPDAKFFHASTSEMFGLTRNIRTEESSFHPRNPYAISKCYSHWIAVNYRETYKMFICCGILFNHESPRRDDQFITKKIAKAAAEIKNGTRECVSLGNLDVRRDWGFAGDYVKAMWMMLQHEKPDDYIVATGEIHTAREFLELAFSTAGIDIKSNSKKGLEEEYTTKDNKAVVKISKEFFRPIELESLSGDNSKIRNVLRWEPKVRFRELVKMMVEEELHKGAE
jgi:GDPmannose 4,6-dehydratase